METIEAERPTRPPLPTPLSIELMEVEWRTVETKSGTLLVLTPKEFEALSYNLAEILRWVKEAMWRLQYYDAP